MGSSVHVKPFLTPRGPLGVCLNGFLQLSRPLRFVLGRPGWARRGKFDPKGEGKESEDNNRLPGFGLDGVAEIVFA